jgi:hypothetical protein
LPSIRIPEELELLDEELDELLELELELLLELAPLLDEAAELELDPPLFEPLLLLPLSQADSNAREPSNVARAK